MVQRKIKRRLAAVEEARTKPFQLAKLALTAFAVGLVAHASAHPVEQSNDNPTLASGVNQSAGDQQPQAGEQCRWMENSPLSATNLSKLYRSMAKIVAPRDDFLPRQEDKSRFETDEQFVARRKQTQSQIRALGQLGSAGKIIFVRTLDELAAKNLGTYDSSNQTLTISAQNIYSYFYDSPTTAGYNQEITRSKNSYVGTNAFGVSTKVHATTSDDYSIVWHVSDAPLDSVSAEDFDADPPSIVIQLPSATAQKELTNLEFVGAARPVEPYLSTSKSESTPTFDAPYDWAHVIRTFHVGPPCVAVRNRRTHQVLGELQMPSFREH